MKKLMSLVSVVIFLSSLSGIVQAAESTPVAKTSVKTKKHKKSGTAGTTQGKTASAEAIPPPPGKAAQPTATPTATPQKHWWQLW